MDSEEPYIKTQTSQTIKSRNTWRKNIEYIIIDLSYGCRPVIM